MRYIPTLHVDVFLCCTLLLTCMLHARMKGPSGCAQMLWRKSLDGYLRQILNARVYDVAVRCSHRFCLVALLSHIKLSYDLTTSSETTTFIGCVKGTRAC